jgi:DNA-binding protein WhiA
MVKDELSRVTVSKPCCRKAEVSTMLRLAGTMQRGPGGIVIEVTLDTGLAARRLQAGIAKAFGCEAEFLVAPAGGPTENRYLVRLSDSRAGANLARQAGLVDADGCSVSGLPRQVVAGSACDCEAVWRGAVLACWPLIQPGRRAALAIACPGFEAALALAGAARRLRIRAQTRDVRGVDQVVIKADDDISAILTRMGAPRAALAWQERRRTRREANPGSDWRALNIDGANERRCVQAAEAAAARAVRALIVLGQDAPEHLAAAGKLRIAHRRISLTELAQLADPPLTKDALADRIRRLLARADRCAAKEGTPDTEGHGL